MTKKFTKLIAALALLVFMTPSMVGWGQTVVTFNPGTDTGATSVTKGDITVTMTTMNNADYYQIYANQSGTFSTSNGSITKIEFTCTASGTSKYGPGNASADVGSYSYSGNKGTWTGNAQSVTISSTQQVRMSSLTITYTPAPIYTITAQSNNINYGTVSLDGIVITGSPKNGYRYASPAYSVNPENSATVVQNDNEFIVTPSANTTVTINFEAIPTHTATFSVNGATSSQNYLEGASIEFPDDPANISGRKFVGWTKTTIAEPTDEEPSFVNTDTETMGNSNVTYYAVFAIATPGDPVETLTQTLEYDTWNYSESNTSNQNTYRLFGEGGYVESASFDLSKLTKVTVYGGTYGGESTYNTLTIGDGANTWKNVTITGKVATTPHEYTDGTALTGTGELYITSTCGNASSSGIRMSKVEIYTMEPSYTYSGYCTSVTAYTITAASNNTEYGTVSLSGEVITGSPQSGCRYATPAYTVSPANSATVVQDGNEFTVTPSANTTVTINFELIPTYTLSSAVSPENAGMVTLGASSGLLEGATVSAEAAANAGYKFTGWSISGSGATLSSPTDNPTTVTIGTANATVTATFEEVTTYAITYSVNGITNTVNVEENTAVDLSAPSSALIPVGYVFKGWRTSELALTDTDPNDYVTSATSTANITYYAVMASESLSNSTWTLDYDTDVSSLSLGYGTAVNVTASDGSAWVVKAYKNNGMQINTGKNSSIKVPTCSGNIQSIAITCTVAKAVGFSISDYSGSGTITYVVYGTDATSQTLDLSSEAVTTGYIVPKSGSTSITNIVVTYKVANYSDFCTSVSSVTLAEDVTIAGDLNVTSYTLTIPSGRTLAVNGTLICYNAANLIIEDGGQLIHGSAGVKATVKKLVKSFDDTEEGGWKFIASPIMETVAATAVTNMIDETTPANYDLYFYDEAAHMWRNFKPGTTEHPSEYYGFNIAPQKGYLYAKTSDVELQFAGTMQPIYVDMSVDLSYEGSGNLQGWNLVGNPFAFNAYTNRSYYVTSYDSEAENKTILAEYAASQNEPIPPCTGIFVKATKSDDVINFSNESYSIVNPEEGTSNNGIIQMSMAMNATNRGNASIVDRALLSFNAGDELEKFVFNENNAKLYISQNGKDYAIAVSEGQGTVPVNFKVAEDGTYTITVNPEGVEMNYLHLIDNMTGADIDLLQTPSYSFNATTNDYESRFRLVFAAANNEDGASTGSVSFAFMSDGNWIINNAGEATLQVIDLNGRILSSERVNGSVSKTINATPGVYMLRLINGENVMVQKIVVR